MAVVDSFGVWENLGVVRPTFDWQFLPLFTNSPTTALRIIYFSEVPEAGFNAQHPWGYLRGVYFSGSSYWFDRNWLRLYPKDEPEILQYPYPPDLMNDPLPQRQYQVKLSDSRYARRLAIDRRWSCQLLKKIDSNVTYPTQEPAPAPASETTRIFRLFRRQ